MTIRRLRPDDQEFLWDALYDAMYVPTGEKPSREILRLPEISCYAAGWMQRPVGCSEDCPAGKTTITEWPRRPGGMGLGRNRFYP
jgi:hypothetical protein